MQPGQSPARTESKSISRFGAIISTGGGGLALLGFLLPWLIVSPRTLSGWFFIQHAGDPFYGLSLTSSAETYLVLAGAIATLSTGILALVGRRSPALKYLQVLGALIGVSDLVLTVVALDGNQFNVAVLGAGFWMVFVGFVLSLVGATTSSGRTG